MNQKTPTENRDFYYDLCKFEALVMTQRNNVLLVFQSMLFAATAVLAHADVSEHNLFFPLWLPMIVGLVLSFLWLYQNSLTYALEERAWRELLNSDERFRCLEIAWRHWKVHKLGLKLRFSVSSISAFVVPALMLAAWIVLLLFYVAHQN